MLQSGQRLAKHLPLLTPSIFSVFFTGFIMEVLIAIVSWTLSATCRNLATDSWIRSVVCHDTSNSLAARLSEGAKIHYPGTEDFDRATNRWSVLDAPDINIVVVPATESDVAETVSDLK